MDRCSHLPVRCKVDDLAGLLIQARQAHRTSSTRGKRVRPRVRSTITFLIMNALSFFGLPELLSHLYLRWARFRQHVSLPLLALLALLQRTPIIQAVIGQGQQLVASSPGQVLRCGIASVAALGAIDTMAGATTFVITPVGSPEGTFAVNVGTAVNVNFTITDTPTPVKSWKVTGTLAPGLSIAGLSGGVVNLANPVILGTVTTAGTYSIDVKAYDKTGGTGKTDGVLYPITFIVSGTAVATAPSITTQPTAQVVTAGSSASFSVTASGTAPLTYQWKFNGTAISGATSSSYTLSNAQSANEGNYSVTVSNSANSVTSSAVSLLVSSSGTAPTFTLQPIGGTVVLGQVVVLNAKASGTPNYQWYKNGTAIVGATDSSLVISSVSSSSAGTYVLKASNNSATASSNPAELSIGSSQRAPMVNVSVLTTSVAGDPFTLGFVIAGTSAQTVIIRASGPSIATLVPGTMANPSLQLFNSNSTVIAENDDWNSTLAPLFAKAGAFAFIPNSKDAALVATLPPGNYTIQIKDSTNGTGKALAEVFLLEQPSATKSED